jgi:hypothetical protein
VRLAAGTHALLLVDHQANQQFSARLAARPGPMCIVIRFLRQRTSFSAQNANCEFL